MLTGRTRRLLAMGVATVLLLLAGAAAFLLRPRPLIAYTPHPPPEVDDILAFRDARLQESREDGVSSEQQERLVLHRTRRSDVVFLYIHGFSGSRGEGELLVDTLAAEWSANVWYLRLPGHGGPGEALGDATADQYFDTVTDALGMANQLGDKVVVVATSTGATLAIWAAATHPDSVDALVLASPLIEFADPTAQLLLGTQHARWMAEHILGTERDLRTQPDPDGIRGPGYAARWMQQYPTRAIVHLEDVRRYATREGTFEAVHQPALLMVYYRDEQHQDDVVDVQAARSAFARFHQGSPHPHSREVAIADGAHVLMSEHVRSDKEAVLQATRDFLRQVVGLPPRERALRARQAGSTEPPG